MIRWLLLPAAVLVVCLVAFLALAGRPATRSTATSLSAAAVVPQTPAAIASAPVSVVYPLKMSANHRYFVDQNNVPFLVVGDSPQSLGTKLTPTQQNTYFSDRQAKGFNTVLIDLLCADYTGGNANGQTNTGVAPFTSGNSPATYDLATPNNAYFNLLDASINLAASYGLVVFLDPVETGSWLTTLQNNGSTKAFNYGVYVGNRYKNFPNVLWFHGNDFGNYIVPSDNNLVGQVIDGIISVDTNHLHTILLGRSDFATNSDVHSNLDAALSSRFGANAAYTFSATANVTLSAYNSTPVTPVFLGEGNYETENILGYPGGGSTPYRIRAENYGALTSGGIGGVLYGHNWTWLSTWTVDPTTRLNSPGMLQIAHINTLMAQVGAWWNLIPDQSHSVVTAGFGSVPANNTDPAVANYCTTSANSSVSLTYCPKPTTLTVAMSTFTGPVAARWYDPSNGTFTAISGSPFANSGSHNFVMPGNNADGNPDWLLLLQAPTPSVVPVSLPNVSATPGSTVTIPISVNDLTGLGVKAYDLQVTFNSAIVQPQATPFDTSGTLSSSMSITPNANNPGHLIISAFQATDLSGSGTLLKLKFTVVGTGGQSSSLLFQDYTDPNTVFHPGFRFNAGNPQASTTNGSITVNALPTITPSPVTRQAGSAGSNSTVATVNDTESGPNGVTVTVTSANPSNGVTVSNIVNTNGTVTADVVAACGATTASFTLTATDGGGATATATLNVTVNANTAPTLTYNSASVPFGGPTTVNPASGPTDNGSIASIVVQSAGTFLGTVGVNSAGVVSISNATPFGSHTITIRSTDNCGAITDATLVLSVTDTVPPDTSINSSPANPSNSSSATFTFSGTDAQSGVASFECKLDAGAFGACISPKNYTTLGDGSHTFQVRAIDNATNQDPTPASVVWVVDTTGPVTTINSNPTNPTNSSSATFTFSATDPGSGVASFECKLDAAAFAACSSPANYTSLSAGAHTFQVRGIDNLNNIGGTQSYPWVINGAPTINPSAVTRQAGSPVSNSTIATVTDVESGAGGVTVTITSANPSNGVTVSTIVNTGGTVTANVVAACGATTTSFTLLATDGGGATATATLNVTVNANAAPTLVYSTPQSVIFGGSLNVTPTTATDNGSITGYSVQSVVPVLTTAPTVNASGTVSITNAQPSGSHVITIRATDNCGSTTDAQFTLNVGGLPAFSIDDVTHNEGNAGTTSYTFTVTKAGSTALNATVDYATVNGTAIAPTDFTAIPTTTLTFLPADTTKQVTVLVNGDVTFEPNEAFTVHLSNVSGATVSVADGTGTITNDDSPLISGHVTYADTATPVNNVTMTLTAPSFTTQTTTTDVNGDYAFTGVPAGNNYTLTPTKTGNASGLESLDASFIARYVAGLDVLTTNQRIAADADGDSILASFDASLIARYVVGLPGSGIVGTWKFLPPNRSYSPLNSDQTNQNFTAILVGDVSGSWFPTLPSGESTGSSNPDRLLAPSTVEAVAPVSAALPDQAAAPGSVVVMAISISDLTGLGVKAYDLQVTYDPLIIQPEAPLPIDKVGTLSSGMNITPNATNAGHLIISAFQADNLTGSGTLLKLKFTVVGTPGQASPLTFEDYPDPNNQLLIHPGLRLNGGSPQASLTSGRLFVHTPTAAPAIVSGRITTREGAPLAGTVMQLSGSAARKTITDADGTYRFDNVNTGDFYTLAPSRINYHFEPDSRSFSVLSNVTDAVFTASQDGVLSGNAIDTPEYFVRQHYLDFLGREPDENGFNFWSDQILDCGGDVGCLERRRDNVSAAYFLSIEFQETGGLVDGLYRASYERRPLFAEFMPDTATVARDVIVGRAGWAQTLESNKQAFVDAWVSRPAFRTAYDGLTNVQFVDELIGHTRVSFSLSERDALVNSLSSGATRAAVLRRIVEDERFVRAKRNEAFVMMQYFGYLRRDPDENGYQFWLNKLNQFGGNFEQAEMVRAFLISGEYRQRFR